MEKALRVRAEKQKFIPAVTHVDGTARLQTVTKDQNHIYYNLINAFIINGYNISIGNCKDLKPNYYRMSDSITLDTQSSQYVSNQNRFIADTILYNKMPKQYNWIIFPNYFTPPHFLSKSNKILTVIHDLQYKYYPEYFSHKKIIWLNWAIQYSLKKADLIIAISNSTKEDLVKYYGDIADKKVQVIPNPIDWIRFGDVSEESSINPDPFILSVANHFPHKNLETLLQAFYLVQQKIPDLKLILVGQKSQNINAGKITSGLIETVRKLEKEGKLKIKTPFQINSINGADKVTAISVKNDDGKIEEIKTDCVLGFFGLIMKLGPIAEWGLNLDKKHIPVNTENFQTNKEGIFAIGDICIYPGKLKLILSGFHEGALAARACFKLARPSEKYRFEFTTTSKSMHERLGVKDK